MNDKKPDNAGTDNFDVPTYDPSNPSRFASGSKPQETREYNSDAPTSAAPSSKPAGSPFERPGRAQPKRLEPQAGGANPNAETTAFPASSPAQPEQKGEPKFAQTSEDYARADRPQSQPAPASQQPAQAGGAAQPAYAAPAAAPASTVTDEPVETPEERAAREEQERLEAEKREGYKTYGKRGTIDFGLLFVRLALSVYLIVAGAATFFNLGDSQGLAGLESEFAGYAVPGILAIVVPTLQLIAGVFLLLGLVTPLAAMIGLVVTGFTALHALTEAGSGLDIFAWPESVWLSLVLFVIAFALQFTGPGFYSLDFGRSWARRPLATSWIFVILGVAALVAAWWFGAGVNPIA